MSDLPGEMVPEFEEHLFVCENCRVRLEQAEQFLSVARAACAEVRRDQKNPVRNRMAFTWLLGGPRGALAGAFAILVMALGIPVLRDAMRETPRASLATSEVHLQMWRGIGEDMSAHAAPGKLILHADVSELRQMPVYVLQLVSKSGSEIWKGKVPAIESQLRQEVPLPVRVGGYWVRVYGANGSDLLREYGLEVK
jgi:hypothetical protein